ncbi:MULTISPECIES: M24 family metallopeptidase [unclassified Pseudomonas]|uniref:M24 family metallopeptidase n=1 Tax=unclassified Pseudomonas TaxID=196821 RepID=UPI0024488A60|nr:MULTISPECIES: M24 family metallopeptidase [unclassified Pseudomonas]MDH0300853.1 aminopeptidase P family protein [Pseudomonas sp. GD04091]MDH1985238.1 aminopeptidase P family protein [Pseudomonas sp. GD03689]
MTPANAAKEAVGAPYQLALMKHAQRMTWEAVERIAQGIHPGMRESQARELSQQVLVELGMQRIWHPTHIRFGSNTLKTFKERSEGDPVLGENDIYFIDMGVVWEGHEGDAGTTFVTGNDPQMKACAAAAKTLFDEVQARWRQQGTSGVALYDFAAERARNMGWTLNLDIKGHRVSDFPHAIYRAGNLGAFEEQPSEGLWILEIQIAHPQLPYGAFHEDLLA